MRRHRRGAGDDFPPHQGIPVEDTAAITMRFANGALGTFMLSDTAASAHSWEQTSQENASYASYPDVDCYVVAGTKGSLPVPTMRLKTCSGPASWWEPFDTSVVEVERADPLARQLVEHFCAVVRVSGLRWSRAGTESRRCASRKPSPKPRTPARSRRSSRRTSMSFPGPQRRCAAPHRSIATVCLSGMLEDKLVAAARAGFDGVEIFENDLIASPSHPTEVRQRCEDLGLSIDLYQPFRDFEAARERSSTPTSGAPSTSST